MLRGEGANCREPETFTGDGSSCVGWHRDDEPLFGECGEAVSFGSSAVFKWRRQSCPDDEGHLCWLGHGDILVMDGQCQDEFPSQYKSWSGTGTDKRYVPLDQTTCCLLLLSENKSGMLFANVCAGFISFCHEVCGEVVVFGLFGFSLVPCAYGRY